MNEKAYTLLIDYYHDAKVKGKGYFYSENYYKNLYKAFSYPLTFITCVISVISGLHFEEYIIIRSIFNIIIINIIQ